MTMTILPFNPEEEGVKNAVHYILDNAPIQHITEDEVLTTIRLLQLELSLQDTERSKYRITIYRDDERLQNLPDDDKLLAMLLHCFYRGKMLLQFKLLRYFFGNTDYQWRKVIKRCPIIDTASQTVEGKYGGRYLGKGWVIAKHIQSLRIWIIQKRMENYYQLNA